MLVISVEYSGLSTKHQPEDKREDNTYQDACSYREIEMEVFSVYYDIPWQFPEPGDFYIIDEK